MSARAHESLRLFIALWPDDATATALMQLQASLSGRLVPYANLHLTLAFLGQQNAEMVPVLSDILRRLPPSVMTLPLDRIGYFSRNRIVWIGMHGVPASLIETRERLAHALSAYGISFDDQRSFKPHITLARDAAAPPDTDFEPIVWQARDLVLIQSITAQTGSQYQNLFSRTVDRPALTPDAAGTDSVSPLL